MPMATTGLDIFDRAVQKANLWLDDLSDEMGWDNRHRAFEAMGVVLRAFRDQLPVQEAVAFGAQLPLLIRGLYFQNWDVSHNPGQDLHLDEFMRRVLSEFVEHRTPAPVDSLVRAVVRVLAGRLTQGQLSSLRRALPPDLRVLWDVRGLPDEKRSPALSSGSENEEEEESTSYRD